MGDIKTCPFCGAKNADAISNTAHTGFYVHCHNCGADGPWANNLGEAIDSWNRRFDIVEELITESPAV